MHYTISEFILMHCLVDLGKPTIQDPWARVYIGQNWVLYANPELVKLDQTFHHTSQWCLCMHMMEEDKNLLCLLYIGGCSLIPPMLQGANTKHCGDCNGITSCSGLGRSTICGLCQRNCLGATWLVGCVLELGGSNSNKGLLLLAASWVFIGR